LANPFEKPQENRGPSWVAPTVVPAAFTPPTPPLEPSVSEVVTTIKVDDKTEKKDKCLARIGEILIEHNNLESNIHPRHEYWSLLHQYRAM